MLTAGRAVNRGRGLYSLYSDPGRLPAASTLADGPLRGGPCNEVTNEGTYTCTYDAAGEELTKTNASGDTWTFTYDNAGHVTSAVEKTSGGTLENSITYQYDVFGNLIEEDATHYSGGKGGKGGASETLWGPFTSSSGGGVSGSSGSGISSTGSLSLSTSGGGVSGSSGGGVSSTGSLSLSTSGSRAVEACPAPARCRYPVPRLAHPE